MTRRNAVSRGDSVSRRDAVSHRSTLDKFHAGLLKRRGGAEQLALVSVEVGRGERGVEAVGGRGHGLPAAQHK